MTAPPSIGVVGGGIAGLYTAWLLVRALGPDGGRVILFETSDRLGGRIETMDFSPADGPCRCGHLLAEFGPMRFEEPVQGRFLALCEALEVERRDFPAYRGEPISYPRYQLDGSELLGDDELGSLDLLRLGILRMVREGARRNRHRLTPPLPAGRLRAEDVFRRTGAGEVDLVPRYAEWFQSSNEETYRFLRRHARIGNVPLHELGLWNALEIVLSHQAVMKIRDLGTFYHLLPHNPSAAEWGVFWIRGFGLPPGEQMKQIVGGTSQLTNVLAARLAGSIDLRMCQEVIEVAADPTSERVVLTVRDKAEPDHPVYDIGVDHAVLALPSGAALRLCEHVPQRIRAHLESVIGFPLIKAFLVTADHWWGPDQKPQAGAGRVPTRELHYYTEKATPEPNGGGPNGIGTAGGPNGMVMMYTDHPADEFWRAFVGKGESHDRPSLFLDRERTASLLGWTGASASEQVLATGDGAGGLGDNELLLRTMVRYLVDFSRPLSRDFAGELLDRWVPEVMHGDRAAALAAIRAAVMDAEDDRRAAVLQDSLTFQEREDLYDALVAEAAAGRLAGDPRVVAVSEALFEDERRHVRAYAIRDWSRPPYFAGAHVWRPGARSWEALADLAAFGLLGSKNAANCHVCGEAYSDYQGFIEGALRSSESVVATIVGREAMEAVRPPDVALADRKFVRDDDRCRVCRPPA